MMNVTSLAKFISDWDIDPVVGMRLKTCEPVKQEDYDWELKKWKDRDRKSYDCTVTRIEKGEIYIKRDDREYEELANVDYTSPPSEEDGDDEDD